MATENERLIQQDSTQPADVLPGGRRPEGKTSAELSQATPVSIPDVQVKMNQPAARRKFSAAHKLKILAEYEACDNALARGALLRREGLYHSRLSAWRKQRDQGTLSAKAKGKMTKSVLTNQKLTRENTQLKKQLEQATAIIEIQKKVSDLLGTYILPAESNEEG